MTGDSGRTVTAQVPQDRSMIGIIATNGLISGGVYKEDGWVYYQDIPIRKWHITIEGHRIWEPRLEDLPDLYRIFKKTQAANNVQWKKIQVVIDKLWKGHKSGQKVIAHAQPTHHHDGSCEDWWEYDIHNDGDGYGLCFGFHWTKGRPKRVINHKLGKQLYDLERRWWDNTCRRVSLARTIFYYAMKKSLPLATENTVISLQFGEDTYWFHSQSKGSKIHWWEMFEDKYKFTIKRIV